MRRRRLVLSALIVLGIALQVLVAVRLVRPGVPTYVGLVATLVLVIGVGVDAVRLNPLELHIAQRYLRSRRASRLLSLITVIAVGGVTVGAMALVAVLGVMNGLQEHLRDTILLPHPPLPAPPPPT